VPCAFADNDKNKAQTSVKVAQKMFFLQIVMLTKFRNIANIIKKSGHWTGEIEIIKYKCLTA